jgi:DNA polymerase (family X)
MTANARIIAVLAELARLTTLDEGSSQSFKVRAYENAIHGIEGHPGKVIELDKSQLIAIKGVGGSIADKIREFLDTGSIRKLEELRAKYPPAFVELMRIPGLGPKTLKLIREELGIENLEDLRAAIERQALRSLAGLGKTSEEKIARAIERLGLHGKDRRTPIADALPIADGLVAELAGLAEVEGASFAGSLRRFAESIGDIDIVVAASDPAPVMSAVATHPAVSEVIGSGNSKTSVLTRGSLQVDVRVVRPEQMGAALLYFTGSKAHNIVLRQRALDRGWLLNEYGLEEEGKVIAAETEEDIYSALDLHYIVPPMRENSGEVEASAVGNLPQPVEASDIRGDLHFHTDRSGDGRASLEEMVAAAAGLGFHYLAITDHGENLVINGSSRQEMEAHEKRIRAIQQQYPTMALLYGCELNIGPAGELDYDPDFRLGFDWCVASVHSHFDLPANRQTNRILQAIADPAVNAIGHLTGRYIGRRPGIELELDPILEALADTGIALEVNGALDRLDASSEVIHQAIAQGVKLVVSTDSHHPTDLKRMQYGVLNAQRGWAAKADVANTMVRRQFLAWAGQRRKRAAS